MSGSDDLIETIDFGGRFARQFFNNNCNTSIEGDAHALHILNPITSTPVASENSICDSAYESLNQAQHHHNNHHSRSKSSANTPDHRHQDSPLSSQHPQHIINVATPTTSLDINNNNISVISSTSDSNANVKIEPNSSLTTASNNNNLNSHHNNNNNNNHNDSTARLNINQSINSSIITTSTTPKTTTSPALAVALVASRLNTSNPWSGQDAYQRLNNVDKIERAASLHRTAASYSEPQYTWSGQLPSRSYKNPVYSCKVFIGGVPWDVTEHGLIETFGRYGPLRVQWPGKDGRQQSGHTKAGYVYLIYESERNVKALLQACIQDFGSGSHPEKYYYQLSSRRMRFKEVQCIPWIQADSNYIRNQSGRPEMNRTVFVGALHGMLTAEGLAKIMNDLFGGVAYVGIDTDKYKYPIGSGRVYFNNQKSYLKAVSAAFIEVKSAQFCKKIQVDPYFEPSLCSTCHIQNAPIFCRDCLRYFCKTCWNWHHPLDSMSSRQHRPLMRKKREN